MDTCDQLGRGGDNTWLGGGCWQTSLKGKEQKKDQEINPASPMKSIYHKELRCHESTCLQIKT